MLKTLFLASMLFASVPSRADIVGQVHKVPCKEETHEFCSKEKPHTQSFVTCMEKHSDKLSPECQEKLKKIQSSLDAAKHNREVCSEDFFKLCQGVGFDDDSRNACLHKHVKELSKDCAGTLKP